MPNAARGVGVLPPVPPSSALPQPWGAGCTPRSLLEGSLQGWARYGHFPWVLWAPLKDDRRGARFWGLSSGAAQTLQRGLPLRGPALCWGAVAVGPGGVRPKCRWGVRSHRGEGHSVSCHLPGTALCPPASAGSRRAVARAAAAAWPGTPVPRGRWRGLSPLSPPGGGHPAAAVARLGPAAARGGSPGPGALSTAGASRWLGSCPPALPGAPLPARPGCPLRPCSPGSCGPAEGQGWTVLPRPRGARGTLCALGPSVPPPQAAASARSCTGSVSPPKYSQSVRASGGTGVFLAPALLGALPRSSSGALALARVWGGPGSGGAPAPLPAGESPARARPLCPPRAALPAWCCAPRAALPQPPRLRRDGAPAPSLSSPGRRRRGSPAAPPGSSAARPGGLCPGRGLGAGVGWDREVCPGISVRLGPPCPGHLPEAARTASPGGGMSAGHGGV